MSEQDHQDTIERWHEIIWGDRPEGGVHLVSVGEDVFMVTEGTGDGSYAYDVVDVEAWIEAYKGPFDDPLSENYDPDDPGNYNHFCQAVWACVDIDVALKVFADTNIIIDDGGTPLLDDDGVKWEDGAASYYELREDDGNQLTVDLHIGRRHDGWVVATTCPFLGTRDMVPVVLDDCDAADELVDHLVHRFDDTQAAFDHERTVAEAAEEWLALRTKREEWLAMRTNREEWLAMREE